MLAIWKHAGVYRVGNVYDNLVMLHSFVFSIICVALPNVMRNTVHSFHGFKERENGTRETTSPA